MQARAIFFLIKNYFTDFFNKIILKSSFLNKKLFYRLLIRGQKELRENWNQPFFDVQCFCNKIILKSSFLICFIKLVLPWKNLKFCFHVLTSSAIPTTYYNIRQPTTISRIPTTYDMLRQPTTSKHVGKTEF